MRVLLIVDDNVLYKETCHALLCLFPHYSCRSIIPEGIRPVCAGVSLDVREALESGENKSYC